MFRTPIINQNDIVLGNDGRPLVRGKVDVLDPVSTNPIDVWSYSDDTYSVYSNPVILDVYGRPEVTVFCDRIAYLRAYAYKGLDEWNQPIYEFVRDWYAGENENTESREYVIGMEALKDLDPTVNSSVNVLGYYNAYDCPLRSYTWDSNCSLDPDNGYIVKSDVSDTGRWILQFAGEYIPSQYYGVMPGSIANMNALLSYPAQINGKYTAPGIWFGPGIYGVNTSLATLKKVCVDRGAYFSCAEFVCDSIEVKGAGSSSPICDFVLYNSEQEVHSSWFKTIVGFYTCGADTLVYDNDNDFSNTVVSRVITLEKKTLIGETRLPATYSENCYIKVDNCNILATKIWDPTDYVHFAHTVFKDTWFSSPSSIDFVNKVHVSNIAVDVIRLDNFSDTTAYVNAMGANGESILDLAGRHVSSLTVPQSVSRLRNIDCDTLTCNRPNITLYMDMVRATSATVTTSTLVATDCVIAFANEPTIASGIFSRCTVAGYTWTSGQVYSFAQCDIGVNFARAVDNTTLDGGLGLVQCRLNNSSISAKNLTCQDCTFINCTIKVYPYKVSDTYYMYAHFSGCTFSGNTPVEFTKFDDDNCYGIKVNWTIVGNTFVGNEEGLRCRYWQNRLGSNGDKTFIAFDSDNVVVYKDNSGNCPADTGRGGYMDNSDSSKFYQFEIIEDNWATLYKGSVLFAMPSLKDSVTAYHWNISCVNGNGYSWTWAQDDHNLEKPSRFVFMYPVDALNSGENGSLFKLAMSINDKLTQAAAGHVRYWEFT